MSNGEDANSLSGSSSDSQKNQPVMFRDTNNTEFGELTLYGPSESMFSRTGTVRRVNSSNIPRKEKDTNETTDIEPEQLTDVRVSQTSPDLRYRRSLDSTYRLSLESISEYKPKMSFTTASSLYPNRGYSSLESSSSDCTLSDNVVKSCTELTNQQHIDDNGCVDNEKTIKSSASSYLSWIESVHSEYFGTTTEETPTTISDNVAVDVDGKVGEWNNFWLNYSSARNRYLSSTTSQYLSNYNNNNNSSSNGKNNNTDDLSDIRSSTSTQKEFIDRNSLEQICMNMEEINEIMNCSKRIIEILEKAINRNEHEFNDSKNDSFYSQPYSRHTSIKEEPIIAPRERSFSYAIGVQDFQKTKLLSKSAPQSSSSSCINAILSTTGVGEILKKVIAKRRDLTTNTTSVSSIPASTAEELPRLTRASFSEWTFGR